MSFIRRRTIIENHRGLLFKKGKYTKFLEAGRYYETGDTVIEILDVSSPLNSAFCNLDTLLKDETIASQTAVVEVMDNQLALHYINGKFTDTLNAGKYAFWTVYDKHEFTIVDITSPEIADSILPYILPKLSAEFCSKVVVAEFQKARLLYNQKFVRLLDAGTYYFWKNDVKIDVDYIDIRRRQLNITGQDILTKDKVGLRINCVCDYKVNDYVKIFTEIENYEEQLHVAVQLALRDYVGKYSIDEILESKEQMSHFVFDCLKAKESELYVEIFAAGVKDIILPGEIRDIMNTVLIAEKRAQANVITRREEVASTRSLLNTAKLMDENQTLYKLKELEYIERICSNVNNLSFNGGDIAGQLLSALNKNNSDGNS